MKARSLMSLWKTIASEAVSSSAVAPSKTRWWSSTKATTTSVRLSVYASPEAPPPPSLAKKSIHDSDAIAKGNKCTTSAETITGAILLSDFRH